MCKTGDDSNPITYSGKGTVKYIYVLDKYWNFVFRTLHQWPAWRAYVISLVKYPIRKKRRMPLAFVEQAWRRWWNAIPRAVKDCPATARSLSWQFPAETQQKYNPHWPSPAQSSSISRNYWATQADRTGNENNWGPCRSSKGSVSSSWYASSDNSLIPYSNSVLSASDTRIYTKVSGICFPCQVHHI